MSKVLHAYIRVSSKAQLLEGESIETQIELAKKVAKKLNLEIQIRNEGASSSTQKNKKLGRNYRVELENLKDDISDGLVKHLWVYDRSRMFRDVTDSMYFRREYLEKYKVTYYEGERGNVVNFDSIDEKFTYDLLTRVQQLENEKRSEKSKQGKRYLLRRAEKNRHYGGTVLFGYSSQDGVLSVNKKEAKWVNTIFKSYLSGKSILEIKKLLDTDGLADNIKARRSATWNYRTIEVMLRNRAYIGECSFYDKELKEEFTYRIADIVSKRLFDDVQKLIKSKQTFKDNAKKHYTLFDDILVCECGNKIGSEIKNQTKASGYQYQTKRYYCVSKSRNWKLQNKDSNCSNSRATEMEQTNDFLVSHISEIAQNSVLLKEKFKTEALVGKKEKDENIKAREKKLDERRERYMKQQEETVNNIASIETDLLQGRREKEIAKKIIKNLKIELDNQRKKLSEVESEYEALYEEREWIDWIKKYSKQLKIKASKKDADLRNWIKGLVKNVVVHAQYGEDRNGKLAHIGHKFTINFKLAVVKDSLKYADEKQKNLGYKVIEGRNSSRTKMLELQRTGRKKKAVRI